MASLPDLNRSYVKAIKAAPYLTKSEELALAERWRDYQDERARDRLISAHLRMVLAIANRMNGHGLSVEEMVAEGNVGLLRALDKFDPALGHRFATFASFWVKSLIHEAAMQKAAIVKVVGTSDQRKLFRHLPRLKVKHGFYGSGMLPYELATQIGAELAVSADAVIDMDRRLAGTVSLDSPTGDKESDDLRMVDTLAEDEENGPDVILERKQEKGFFSMLTKLGLAQLNERERIVIESRVLSEDPVILGVLAKRFGVSVERTRQIEAKALKKMRAAMTERASLLSGRSGYQPALVN